MIDYKLNTELKTKVIETFEPYAENIETNDNVHFQTSLGLFVLLTDEENYYYNNDMFHDMETEEHILEEQAYYVNNDYIDFSGLLIEVK